MKSRILHDEMDVKAWCRFLEAQPLPMTVSQTEGARRTNPQNSLFHEWIGQIADEVGQSAAETKAEIKLRFGLPIMEAENAAWVAKWEPLYGPLAYVQRLKLFEVLPLTSVMTTRQMAALLDAVHKEYTAQAIELVDPDARRYEAEMGGRV